MSATDPMTLSALPAALEPAPRRVETELVLMARDGDRGSFGRLYEIYAPMVHGILLSRVPVHDVDDLVHEVFLSALRKIRSLRDPEAFPAWIAGIARNCATDRHRRSARRREVGLAPDDETDAQTATRAPQREESEALAVISAIRGLPDAYRETLVLRLVEGMTGPEIAEKTGLTPGSVRVNLHRGMKLLRAAIEGNRP